MAFATHPGYDLSNPSDPKRGRQMDRGYGTDLRYVLRVLRRSPGFVAVAILSLAVGIGANAAMFGVVRGLLIKPLPVGTPHELAVVGWRRDADLDINQFSSTSYTDPEGGERYRSNFSYPVYSGLRAAAPEGVRLFAFTFLRSLSVGMGEAPPLLAGGVLVDGSYFSVLRAEMALGRPLTEADDQPGAPLVTVLSHALWMRAFGGDPSIIGRTARINGVAAEVVGVTVKDFRGLSQGGFFPQTDVTVTLAAQARVVPRIGPRDGGSLRASHQHFWLRVMARLSEDVSKENARDALRAALVAQPSPMNEPAGPPAELGLLPGARGAQPVRGDSARMLMMLLGVVASVLLIACVNLATLMLARGVALEREMAVRRALGGGRMRLVRQMLLESLVLAGAGTVAGLMLAFGTRGALAYMVTKSMGSSSFGNVVVEGTLDPAVIGVAAALGVLATLLFGLLPAVRLSDVDPMAWLKHRSAGAVSKLTVGRVLLALQIAVSVPLIVGAALFLRTVGNLNSVELGFDPQGMSTFQLDPAFTGLEEDQYSRIYREVLSGVEQIPGVRSVTLMENAFMSGIISNTKVTVDGEEHGLYMNAVGPAFLETTGMRLVSGRMPGIQDDSDSPSVGVVNERAVAKLFGGTSPVGRILQVGSREVEIVGVINDARYDDQRGDVQPTLYDAALQRGGFGGHKIVLRSDVPLGRLENDIRQAVAQVDRNLPVPEIQVQTALISQASSSERVFTQLLTLFGAFALLLASIGLHGVTAYWVSRRTSEFGVRVAVGARPGQVQWLVLRQVLVLVGAGLLVGIPASLAAGPLVGSLLYDVAPNDPTIIAAASSMMLVVALGAGFLPAQRAARLDALAALRKE